MTPSQEPETNGRTDSISIEMAEGPYGGDAEPITVDDPERRALEFKARHIQMMALGSCMASGLFFQSGTALYEAGPVSMWLAYLLMGSISYAVLISLGEMISLLPVAGGFITLANRCLSPAVGFTCGWSYWFARSLSFALQLVAIQNTMSFWLPEDRYRSAWIISFFAIVFLFNLLNVRRYGEIEYWLTVVKLETIIGIIILGILLPMGASVGTRLLATGPNHTPISCPPNPTPKQCLDPPGFPCISFRIIIVIVDWASGPAFNNFIYNGAWGRLVGFWAACCQGLFSYLGVEIIGIVAEETERQSETLPHAVRRVAYRAILYHVGAVIVLGLNVSRNDPILQFYATQYFSSPFVLMVNRAGILSLRHIINAVTVIALLCAANTRLYVASRTLYALAKERQAFKIFERKGWWNVPIYAIVASAAPAFLAFITFSLPSNTVYKIFQQLVMTCVLTSWAVICATYLRFRCAVNVQHRRGAIPPKARSSLQPYLAIYGFVMSTLFIIFQGYEVFTRGESFWSAQVVPWVSSITSWVTIGALFFLTLAWYVYGYALRGEWSWEILSLLRVDISSGAASRLVQRERSKGYLWFLENI